MPITVQVDQKRCATVGICVKELPEIFRFQRGSKKAEVKVDIVPSHLGAKCIEVAKKCPNGAIIVKEV